jgi:predicted histone-like DNA-binding protein
MIIEVYSQKIKIFGSGCGRLLQGRSFCFLTPLQGRLAAGIFQVRIHSRRRDRIPRTAKETQGTIRMTIKYNTIERGNPARPESGTKFYHSIESTGRVTLRDLVEEISEMSSLTSADMMAAVESLLLIIPRELTKGNIVELGDFGNFWLRSTSEGTETAGKVSGDQITSLIPRFNAGRQFKRVLRSAKFEKKTRHGRKNIVKSFKKHSEVLSKTSLCFI